MGNPALAHISRKDKDSNLKRYIHLSVQSGTIYKARHGIKLNGHQLHDELQMNVHAPVLSHSVVSNSL